MNFGTIQVADIFVGALNAIEAYFGTEKVWEKSSPPPTADWLCFTAQEANSTVRLDKNGSPDTIYLETSTDGNTWTDYSWTGRTGDTLTLANVGDKVYMRAKTENQTISKDDSNYYKFIMSGRIAASGNIQTLLKADGTRIDAPDYCYSGLFYNCSSLTTAPELPATTLANRCYNGLFRECTSLTTAPVLPATTLTKYCYRQLFSGCTSLTTAPALPATTLAESCYSSMFSYCESLTTAPALPATTLADYCYWYMFNGCSSLNSIKLGYTGNFSGSFTGWVQGVASSGTFYYNGSDTKTGTSAIPSGWTVQPITTRPELCFTAEEANSTVAMTAAGSAPTVSLEYSTDGENWNPFVVGTTTVTLANIGDKVYVRATSAGNTGMGTSTKNYNKFVMTGKIAASGNVNTLLDQNGNATLTDYCYFGMFYNCTSLTTAPELPATTLANGCYYNMFQSCTSLTSAPALPATTLADICYAYMFYNCSSLTTAPTLPATTLAKKCYKGMFQGCSSLTTAPELPATTLAESCYEFIFSGCTNLNTITLGYTGNFSTTYFNSWVNGVAASGTFYYNGSDTTTGKSAIPTGWTVTPFTP